MSAQERAVIELRGYRLTAVYGCLTPGDRQAIVRMWIDAGVLPPAEAQRRVTEVVVTAHDPGGSLAGVNTVYVAETPGAAGRYYFYRTYIRPAHRGVRGVPTAMLELALTILRRHPHALAPLGVVIVAENPKLMRASVTRRLRALGFTLLGRDARGCDVWCLKFDGSTPVAPPGVIAPPQ
jgi:predicted GNAT family acetyltransferase